MGKGKNDNKAKRKRGKKFVFQGGDEKAANELQEKAKVEKNPFELHSRSKKIRKDAAVREGLVEEYKQRGRLSTFVDKRIGEGNSQLTEDDKMKLRYMREQRDQLKGKSVALTRKKAKFNLGEDSGDDDDYNFLTHKGKKLNLEELDDFKDEIS